MNQTLRFCLHERGRARTPRLATRSTRVPPPPLALAAVSRIGPRTAPCVLVAVDEHLREPPGQLRCHLPYPLPDHPGRLLPRGGRTGRLRIRARRHLRDDRRRRALRPARAAPDAAGGAVARRADHRPARLRHRAVADRTAHRPARADQRCRPPRHLRDHGRPRPRPRPDTRLLAQQLGHQLRLRGLRLRGGARSPHMAT